MEKSTINNKYGTKMKETYEFLHVFEGMEEYSLPINAYFMKKFFLINI